MKNIKEFKELIERYETITLKEVQAEWGRQKRDGLGEVWGDEVSEALTGMGSTKSCTLCLAVHPLCSLCVYQEDTGCVDLNDRSQRTYDAVQDSKSPSEMIRRFRSRAKFMRSLLKKKGVS